jgi:hypothetical protein
VRGTKTHGRSFFAARRTACSLIFPVASRIVLNFAFGENSRIGLGRFLFSVSPRFWRISPASGDSRPGDDHQVLAASFVTSNGRICCSHFHLHVWENPPRHGLSVCFVALLLLGGSFMSHADLGPEWPFLGWPGSLPECVTTPVAESLLTLAWRRSHSSPNVKCISQVPRNRDGDSSLPKNL